MFSYGESQYYQSLRKFCIGGHVGRRLEFWSQKVVVATTSPDLCHVTSWCKSLAFPSRNFHLLFVSLLVIKLSQLNKEVQIIKQTEGNMHL